MNNIKHSFNWIGMSEDGDQVILNKFSEEGFLDRLPSEDVDPAECAYGVVVDFETTGFSPIENDIIEIGLRRFLYRKTDGVFVRLDESYQSFQEPRNSIPKNIEVITGINDSMVKNQKIDWEDVNLLLKDAEIIIAHNAGFDRPFMDRHSLLSQEKLWGCSVKNINWLAKGFPSAKLELLSVYHGFYNSAHRALSDVESLLYLLTHSDPETKRTYLSELIENAQIPSVIIEAKKSPFEKKDFLKQRGYRWNNKETVWAKTLSSKELESEVSWLTSEIYQGRFLGEWREIPPQDQYKM